MANKSRGASRPSPSRPITRGKRARVGKRELIDTGIDKRYVRREASGQFRESDDVGRSLSKDVRKKAKTKVASGSGDKGDQKRKARKK